MNERRIPPPRMRWPNAYFALEEKNTPSEPAPAPTDRPSLTKNMRVSFDVHQGAEGPPYATNVRITGWAPE